MPKAKKHFQPKFVRSRSIREIGENVVYKRGGKEYRIEKKPHWVGKAVAVTSSPRSPNEVLFMFKYTPTLHNDWHSYTMTRVHAKKGILLEKGTETIRGRKIQKDAFPTIYWQEGKKKIAIKHFDAGSLYKKGIGELLLRQLLNDVKKPKVGRADYDRNTQVISAHNKSLSGVKEFYERFGFRHMNIGMGRFHYVTTIGEIEDALRRINRERLRKSP